MNSCKTDALKKSKKKGLGTHYNKKNTHNRLVKRFGEEGLKKMIHKSPEDIYEQ